MKNQINILKLFIPLFIITSCSSSKKIIGNWQWVDYNYKAEVAAQTSEEDLQKFNELKKQNLIQMAIKGIQIEFYDNQLFELYQYGTVMGGPYSFTGKKEIALPHGILKSKTADTVKIEKVDRNILLLSNDRFLFELKRIIDEKYEQNKKLPTADFSGTWNNSTSKGKLDDLLIFEFEQQKNVIKGTLKVRPTSNRGKGSFQFEDMPVNGSVIGNLARIEVRQKKSGQSSYRYTIYHCELEKTGDWVEFVFKSIRYEDKNGQPVYMKTSIYPPFPNQMKLNKQ